MGEDRQKVDSKFKRSLLYVASSRQTRANMRPHPQRKNRAKQTKKKVKEKSFRAPELTNNAQCVGGIRKY